MRWPLFLEVEFFKQNCKLIGVFVQGLLTIGVILFFIIAWIVMSAWNAGVNAVTTDKIWIVEEHPVRHKYPFPDQPFWHFEGGYLNGLIDPDRPLGYVYAEVHSISEAERWLREHGYHATDGVWESEYSPNPFVNLRPYFAKGHTVAGTNDWESESVVSLIVDHGNGKIDRKYKFKSSLEVGPLGKNSIFLDDNETDSVWRESQEMVAEYEEAHLTTH